MSDNELEETMEQIRLISQRMNDSLDKIKGRNLIFGRIKLVLLGLLVAFMLLAVCIR